MGDVMFNLRQARQYRHLSQEQVAQAIGVAKVTYQKYETEDRKMRVDKAEKFSKLVGIPMSNIIF